MCSKLSHASHLIAKYIGRMAKSGNVCTLIIIVMKAMYNSTLMKPGRQQGGGGVSSAFMSRGLKSANVRLPEAPRHLSYSSDWGPTATWPAQLWLTDGDLRGPPSHMSCLELKSPGGLFHGPLPSKVGPVVTSEKAFFRGPDHLECLSPEGGLLSPITAGFLPHGF